MTDLESRLRAALQSENERIIPTESTSLDAIRARAVTARAHRRTLVGTVMTVLLIVGAIVVAELDRDDRVGTGPAASDSTSSSTTETATTASTVVVGPTVDYAHVLWPRPSDAAVVDPRQAAKGFFDHWIRGENELSAFRSTAADHGEVDVFAVGEDGRRLENVVSTIHLERISGGWFVTSAASDDLVIDAPTPGAGIDSPLTVDGRGRGYEGHIVATLYNRFDNTTNPRENALGTGIAIGGCCDSLEPFSTSFSFDGEDRDAGGMLIVNNDSGIASIASFMALPVRFVPGNNTEVKVFFHDERGELTAFTRLVPKTTGVLTAALTELVKGPSATERSDGTTSFFSAQTAALFLGVTITDGVADVKFDPGLPEVINNASTSAGSKALVEELNATVFQFPTVKSVRYLLGDSCGAFGDWLQTGSCMQFDHP